MGRVLKSLKELLAERFPGSETELKQSGPAPRKVGGYLIWGGFEGVEQLDRQRQLSQVIRNGLDPDERSQVTTILTVTPAEISVLREG